MIVFPGNAARARGRAEEKYYVAGVGEIWERAVKGHHEEFKLVRVTH